MKEIELDQILVLQADSFKYKIVSYVHKNDQQYLSQILQKQTKKAYNGLGNGIKIFLKKTEKKNNVVTND